MQLQDDDKLGSKTQLSTPGRVQNPVSRPVAGYQVGNLSEEEGGLGQLRVWKLPACIKKPKTG